jgi:hypothetical protein
MVINLYKNNKRKEVTLSGDEILEDYCNNFRELKAMLLSIKDY